jgi:hypothetical protein
MFISYMKCLTCSESQNWFDSKSIQIDGYRNLVFSKKHKQVTLTLPKNALALNYFSAQLTNWIPSHPNRMLWLSNWETDPSDQIVLFETIRFGCGESRPTIEVPGHLFEDDTAQQTAVLTGLSFIILAFNWQGYLVGCNDYIYLGDEFVRFGIASEERLASVFSLAENFELKVIKDIKEAWV